MTYIEFVKAHIRKPEFADLKQTDKIKAIAAMWRKQKGGDLLGDQTVKILRGGDLLGDAIANSMRGGAVLGRRKPMACAAGIGLRRHTSCVTGVSPA